MNFYCFSQLKEISEISEIYIVTIHVMIRRKIYLAVISKCNGVVIYGNDVDSSFIIMVNT
jgi:hypothetical protein